MLKEKNGEIAFTNIGLTRENREQLTVMLDTILADLSLLYVKTRKYHWNVTGSLFQPLHALFEEQYAELAEMADAIAERSRMLGGRPIGTLQGFLAQTRLAEEPGKHPDADTMMRTLLEDHGSLINYLRQDIGRCLDEFDDEGTADLLIGTLRAHEMMAWQLRSTLGAETS